MMNDFLILGAGITGLSAALKTGYEIYEANYLPGGICASYYVNAENRKCYFREDDETYRFEVGGGHWIFGADDSVLSFISSLSQGKTYKRKSAVFFPDMDIYVPFPLQNHLSYLPKDIAQRALNEILQTDHMKDPSNLADWLELHFGKTLCEFFFFPFHELYTAGLFKEIEPQDKYKTPVDREEIIKGFEKKTAPVGYNATFFYPKRGLDDLIRKMVNGCRVNYGKEVTKIDIKNKEILFRDGTARKYSGLISTLPLNKVIKMTNLSNQERELPFTSVLVVNIGGKMGTKCPHQHWIYIPKSNAGFHRIGFYSNVDSLFLPKSSRRKRDKVAIYVEKAYVPEKKPKDDDIKRLCDDIVREMIDWEFLAEAEVINATWIEVAYTWQYPHSKLKQDALQQLRQNGIYQVGRYGLWEFQGLAKSIKDGMEICLEK